MDKDFKKTISSDKSLSLNKQEKEHLAVQLKLDSIQEEVSDK
jgi:hypothetical protein